MEKLVVPDEDVLVGQAAAHAARHGAALPVLAEHLDPGVVVPHLRQRHARQVAAQRGAAPTQTLVMTLFKGKQCQRHAILHIRCCRYS